MQSNENDHVWRFAVQSDADTPQYKDPLVEMVRVFLEDFLTMGFFTYQGNKVQVDGFAFANDPQQVCAIFAEERPDQAHDDA